MADQTVSALAAAAERLSTILLSDDVEIAKARLLVALGDLGFDGYCLGASEVAGTTKTRRYAPLAWLGEMVFGADVSAGLGNFLDAARLGGWLLVPLGHSAGRHWVLAVSRPNGGSADQRSVALLELYGHALKAVLAPPVVPAHRSPPALRWPLSGTQITFLRWAAEGKSSADIALITGSTRRTVDYHFAEILRKLGVASRTQAVAWLAEADSGMWHPGVPDPVHGAG